jgi:thymidine phosphorylase
LEVKEAIGCLEGHGPDDLHELVIECAARLLVQTQQAPDLIEARQRAAACLASGKPRRKWDEMLAAQGVDLVACERKRVRDHTASVVQEIRSDREGFIVQCNPRVIGEIIRDLGGGRLTKKTILNPEVGIDELAKPGEHVRAGSLLARVHAAAAAQAEAAAARLQTAFSMAEVPAPTAPLIQEAL